jgi:hypothetical protein
MNHMWCQQARRRLPCITASCPAAQQWHAIALQRKGIIIIIINMHHTVRSPHTGG